MIGDESSDSITQENGKPQASGADDQELMRVVAELALAKISMAEMSEEKIKCAPPPPLAFALQRGSADTAGVLASLTQPKGGSATK